MSGTASASVPAANTIDFEPDAAPHPRLDGFSWRRRPPVAKVLRRREAEATTVRQGPLNVERL